MSRGNKLIVILGQTASGKTDLSIKLAKEYNGEVVSADSRQVYKRMDIGSGKITKKEMQGIPHHLLDVANPKRKFTVAQYQKLALKAINKIHKKNKLPLLVGGTGFYIQSVVDGIVIPEVKPDWKLRKKLEKFSTEQLFKKLEKLDPKRAESIDKSNPRRLIRALEIVLKTGKPVPKLTCHCEPQRSNLNSEEKIASSSLVSLGTPRNDGIRFSILQLGIKKTPEELKRSINKRLLARLNYRNYCKGEPCNILSAPLIKEVANLHRSGLSWKRLEEFGLEYRFVAQYIQNKITYEEMINKIQKESEHFAKKQVTWFSAHGGSASGGKKNNCIIWIKNYKEAVKQIDKFLSI